MKNKIASLILLICATCLGHLRPAHAAPPPQGGYTLVCSAYDGEMEAVRRLIENETITEERVINGVKFSIGDCNGLPVIFFTTQISMVNAAMNTQLALSNFPVRQLLFSGIAGGINPALKKGDLSVPARWVNHSEGGFFNLNPATGKPLLRPTEKPKYPNFGYFLPEDTGVIRSGLGKRIKMPSFPADSALLHAVRRAASRLPLVNASGQRATIKIGGTGASGPVFMDNRDFRQFLFRTWKADCVDMESAAIAQACWSNRVPCLIIRSLSDLAGGQEGANQIDQHADQAEDNSAKLLAATLQQLR